MKYCAKCGTQMPDDSAFCPNCGSAVEIQNTQQQFNNNAVQNNLNPQFNNPPQEKPKTNSNKVLIIVIAVLAALLIVLIGFFIGSSFNDNTGADQTTTREYDDDSNGGKAVDLDSKYLVDDSNLFTDEEKADIILKLESVSDVYKFDVVVHTTDSFDGKTPSDYSVDYYFENGYGQGKGYDGCIFIINVKENQWYFYNFGKGTELFTDEKVKEIGDEIDHLIKDGYTYDAVLCYIEKTSKVLYDDYYENN